MITLYQFASSPFSDKVKRALNYKGLKFEIHEVNRIKAGRGKYAFVSPTAKFPAIEIDGKACNDSTDIIELLDREYPEKPLLPEALHERAMVHAIEEWADESLYFYEMLMRLQWTHNLDASLPQIKETLPPLPDFMLRRMIFKGVSKVTTAQGLGRKPVDQVVSDAKRHLEAIDGFLSAGDWLVGGAISVADLAVISQLKKLSYAKEIQELLVDKPRIDAWMNRVDDLAPA